MDVISVSSDSDVEIVGAYADADAQAQCGLDAADTPCQIDQTEPKWSSHWLRKFKRRSSSDVIEVIDLVNGTGNTQTDYSSKTFPLNGSDVDPKRDAVKPKTPCPLTDNSKHLSVYARQIEKIHLAAEWPNQPQLQVISNNLQLKELIKKYFGQTENYEEQGGNIQSIPDDKKSPCGSVTGDVVEMPHGAQEDQLGKWIPILEAPSQATFPLSTQEQVHSFDDELVTKPLESNSSDSKQWAHSKQAFLGWTLKSEGLPGTNRCDLNPRPYQSTVLQYPESLTSSEPFHGIQNQANKTPISVDTAHVESTVRETCKVEKDMGNSSSANNRCDGFPGDSTANSEGWKDGDSLLLIDWRDRRDVEEIYEERSIRSASQEDRCYVCPVRLQKLMAPTAPDQVIDEEEDGGFGEARVLCRQSLRLVYSTIEESLPEGSVQLLSDLQQPGFYSPKDITTHLLRGILLGSRCPLHLQVQAFDLLMRMQRHHRVDKTTIPWDWELLTSIMDNQEDDAKRHHSEVVRMLLEYVVRTMEDDFRAKLSPAAIKQSIAREFLSCNCQFTKVRDVIKWLCTAIRKSTEGDGGEGLRETDDHIRMVSVFQKMLHMALEVDCSPVLSSGRLSQELFHMFLVVVPLRSHRKLLLDSMQSELLKCKLLQHLLDHSCPEKTPLPMSLSLLLHFLKNSTPSQEPTDGTQRWPKWEELIELLWMLLLSYNKVNKGDLRSPITETREHVMSPMPNDVVPRLAVCEAVESLLSRSRADLGQALPDHIEESLSYLQDHLLDFCQP